MTDEANSHWLSMLLQLTEGQTWLKTHLNVTPKSSWSIDPFGQSSVMPVILKGADFENLLIQRTHYEVKKYLARRKELEFRWRQTWGKFDSNICYRTLHARCTYERFGANINNMGKDEISRKSSSNCSDLLHYQFRVQMCFIRSLSTTRYYLLLSTVAFIYKRIQKRCAFLITKKCVTLVSIRHCHLNIIEIYNLMMNSSLIMETTVECNMENRNISM